MSGETEISWGYQIALGSTPAHRPGADLSMKQSPWMVARLQGRPEALEDERTPRVGLTSD